MKSATRGGAVTGKRSGRTTIVDVARHAGVSTATAGRALGGYGYAKSEIQARVLSSAMALGYRANHLARSLITGRTNTIGVVAGDIESPFYASVVRGIADVARASGFGVLLTNSDENIEREREAVKLLLQKQVDGIIVSPSRVLQIDHLLESLAAGCPVVQIDRVARELPTDSVTVNNLSAARDCVALLLRGGHRRIGIVAELGGSGDIDLIHLISGATRPDERHPTPAWQRFLGYLAAHREASMPVEIDLIASVESYSAEAARIATQRLLEVRPDGLFTADGMMSVGAMEAIMEKGLSVGPELALICFDDLDWMKFVGPGISAVAQPAQEVGRAAAELVLRRIFNGTVPVEHRVLSARIIERRSTEDRRR